MPAIGFKVGKETFSYEQAEQIAKETGFFFDYPPAALRALKNDRVDGNWLSPSGAGGCHRQRILVQTEDFYQDLVGQWAPGVGTAVHDWFHRSENKASEVITEALLRTTLHVPLRDGTIIPFTLQGTADYYDPATGRGYDYKTISEFDYWHNGRRERVNKEIPRSTHILQAQLYKFLMSRNGLEVKEYYLWYAKLHADGQRRPVMVDLWEDEEIEQIACEIAEPLAWYVKTKELPQNKFDSKNFLCKYCPVKDACRKLAKEGK